MARIGSLGELAEWVTVAAVVGEGATAAGISERPVALLVGEEAHGLAGWIVDAAAHRLTIDTPGKTESLNVAVAAGIAVHELSKPPGGSWPGV
jgi:tRNA G18 (ribose-2'-O)-methylase SpoU